ncbi:MULTISPECIES: type II toxin-antitoxin system RatA family toxin [Gulbenkiania]|uniref:Ribosome association toxin PasT (RatA) of the RatAB toxin-antitoxin module n=2 Tax=Gulbenkiania TaxID=397456 RepID=A0A0K6GSE4_9NEIS|nr:MULTISPECIES: type II toxin-antitoxin system RatA family toxin [Gulbenkiania]TCW32204.1 ribosome-associated toxin RatA of RatAB toxin-antitoxin module [Gulbenkiania mobilis]CUA81473.1 Ribosome association toxin PasT (RatA) of the RatAB toxin-antitoxin module [Gulbenkiania indica]
MQVVEKTVLVAHTPEEMFKLVDTVENYPRFLPWYGKTEVHSREGNQLVASLHIDYLRVKQHFTTRNTNDFPHAIHMALVEGPFEFLEGDWRFHPLGDFGCKVEFRLRYEFSSRLLEKIIGPVFGHISGMLVDAFIKEADRVYGDD